jgi:hypothetical protein
VTTTAAPRDLTRRIERHYGLAHGEIVIVSWDGSERRHFFDEQEASAYYREQRRLATAARDAWEARQG